MSHSAISISVLIVKLSGRYVIAVCIRLGCKLGNRSEGEPSGTVCYVIKLGLTESNLLAVGIEGDAAEPVAFCFYLKCKDSNTAVSGHKVKVYVKLGDKVLTAGRLAVISVGKIHSDLTCGSSCCVCLAVDYLENLILCIGYKSKLISCVAAFGSVCRNIGDSKLAISVDDSAVLKVNYSVLLTDFLASARLYGTYDVLVFIINSDPLAGMACGIYYLALGVIASGALLMRAISVGVAGLFLSVYGLEIVAERINSFGADLLLTFRADLVIRIACDKAGSGYSGILNVSVLCGNYFISLGVITVITHLEGGIAVYTGSSILALYFNEVVACGNHFISFGVIASGANLIIGISILGTGSILTTYVYKIMV